MQVEERFLQYVRVNTESDPGGSGTPSSECQWDFARALARELLALGLRDARVDEHCYVLATLPSNLPAGRTAPALGLIAHLDTAPETSGKNVSPRIVKNYDGGPLVLNREKNIIMDPVLFCSLQDHRGEDLIVTDGTTLLGADDKAGVAEIVTAVEYLLAHPEILHGKLCICFTPDEEIGHGAAALDLAAFGAELAYTVDGCELGDINYENFNAAAATVTFHGQAIHPGSSKNKMVNASLLAAEFIALLPAAETPAHTENREGFFHLCGMDGTVAKAALSYIIRDHDRAHFERRKALLRDCADFMCSKYGADTVELALSDSYRNMQDFIEPHFALVENAKAAMEEVGIAWAVTPVRGGTDGAQLSCRGLPCPNLCAGALNCHGVYEYCSVQDLQKITRFLVALVQKFVRAG